MGEVARDNTLQIIVEELTTSNTFLSKLYGNLQNLNTTNKSNFVEAINEIVNHQKRDPLLKLKYNRDLTNEYIQCTYKGNGSLSVSSSDTSIADVELDGDIVNITRHDSGTPTITVDIAETDTHFSDSVSIIIPKGLRYGYRIKESESDPYARVEYLYDAEGMTPAKMLTSGTFDYGDWKDIWFVKDNKPLMLNSDGTVAYYLNPNNYSLKEDGTSSDVANTSFDGNAMAQMPLVWIKRYSENGYHYEIVSDTQYDSDYKAYAHTRADGSIAPYFYLSIFEGHHASNGKYRSLSGQGLEGWSATLTQQLAAAQANGSLWSLETWSQHEYLRTILYLITKTCNTQGAIGYGCATSSGTSILNSGQLNTSGQFGGKIDGTETAAMKALHIENIYGNAHNRVLGLMSNNGRIYYKMTPEGSNYQTTGITGYTDTGLNPSLSTIQGITNVSCGEYGMIPLLSNSGSGSTYYTDAGWVNTSGLRALISSGYHSDPNWQCGLMNFNLDNDVNGNSVIGARLSCEMPVV